MAKQPQRNDPCPCGSGKKFKNCCQHKENKKTASWLGVAGLVLAVVLGLWLLGTYLSGGGSQQECPPGMTWSDAHQHCH